MGTLDERAVRDRVATVEEAIEELEGLPSDPRRTALDAVAALLDLYGEGWSRALGRLREEWPEAASALAEDELVSHLLLIHGLHPTDVASRVRGALESLEATLDADGTGIELLEVADGVARLRLGGDGRAPPSGVTRLVKETILEAAPDLDGVEVERPEASDGQENGGGLVQLRVSSGLGKKGGTTGTGEGA